jgi:hypothetical protein
VLALRRLLLVDQAPELLEQLLGDETREQAAKDAEGDEEEPGDDREIMTSRASPR